MRCRLRPHHRTVQPGSCLCRHHRWRLHFRFHHRSRDGTRVSLTELSYLSIRPCQPLVEAQFVSSTVKSPIHSSWHMLLFILEEKLETWCYFLDLKRSWLKRSLKPDATFYSWREVWSLCYFLYLKKSLKPDAIFILEEKLDAWLYFLYLK